MYTCFPLVPEVHGPTTELHEKAHVQKYQWICLEHHQGCAIQFNSIQFYLHSMYHIQANIP